MSNEIGKKLDLAINKVREVQSDFDSLKNFTNSSFSFDSKFSSLLMSVATFLSEIDKVYVAMDEAFLEIDRLDYENKDLQAEVEKLEELLAEYAEVG